jgi:hypothetical protein
VAANYTETPIGSLPAHKFIHHAMSNAAVKNLPEKSIDESFRYFIDVYVDDFIPMAVATSRSQLEHVATAVMTGIHDVFPACDDDEDDPISLKKLKKLDGQWALQKDILGFAFDGEAKTMQLEEPKREFLLAILQKWTRSAAHGKAGIPLTEFESVIAKCRHAFMSIPAGMGLLTPCNAILRKRPPFIFLSRNMPLLQAIRDCRSLL